MSEWRPLFTAPEEPYVSPRVRREHDNVLPLVCLGLFVVVVALAVFLSTLSATVDRVEDKITISSKR